MSTSKLKSFHNLDNSLAVGRAQPLKTQHGTPILRSQGAVTMLSPGCQRSNQLVTNTTTSYDRC
eukprot:1215274-Amphidinium_carterae.1